MNWHILGFGLMVGSATSLTLFLFFMLSEWTKARAHINSPVAPVLPSEPGLVRAMRKPPLHRTMPNTEWYCPDWSPNPNMPPNEYRN